MGLVTLAMIVLIVAAVYLIARSWKQQDRLDAARAEVIESEKTRALAEAELNRQRDLAEQSLRLNAAVENMTQGLCMFDKDGRLVVCNDIYAKMYKLPAGTGAARRALQRHHRVSRQDQPRQGRTRPADSLAVGDVRKSEDRRESTSIPTAGSSVSPGGCCRPAAGSRPTMTSPSSNARRASWTRPRGSSTSSSRTFRSRWS